MSAFLLRHAMNWSSRDRGMVRLNDRAYDESGGNRMRFARTVLLCCALAGIAGCSVREYALRSMGDALASGGDVYASDEDIELVGAATPFGLKTIESLLAEVPDHKGLLLAAARVFPPYSYV